ncbi:MAG: hypothetical protein RLZZ142_1272, partial [Verrucomicrobiota bacterium]
MTKGGTKSEVLDRTVAGDLPLTIVIPTYNRATDLNNCLSALFSAAGHW